MQKATMDQPVTHPHGALLITTALVETGIHFFVSDGVQRIDELTKSFSDRKQAKAYYIHISKAAEQGKRIHQIVWEVQALEEAQNAATGRSTERVKADLNADGTAYLAAETAIHNQVVQLRDEIMADADPNWRANLRKQVVQAAQQTNRGRNAPVLRRGVTGKASPAGQHLLRRMYALGGTIARGRDADIRQLTALARENFVTLTARPGTRTHDVATATITETGRRYVQALGLTEEKAA